MADSRDVIRADAPADVWAEGHPIGNGRLGAMVLGHPCRERVALNHDRLWRRYWTYQQRKTGADVPALRRLVRAGKWEEAYQLMAPKIGQQGQVIYVNPFVPLGDLGIYPFHYGRDEIGDYRRSLDMDRGVAEVE